MQNISTNNSDTDKIPSRISINFLLALFVLIISIIYITAYFFSQNRYFDILYQNELLSLVSSTAFIAATILIPPTFLLALFNLILARSKKRYIKKELFLILFSLIVSGVAIPLFWIIIVILSGPW